MARKPFLEVLYEDNHLLVVCKPAGILVQGDTTGDFSLVDLAKDYLKFKYRKPGKIFVGLVHRLDRPVSGVLLLARTSKALERMNQAFKDRKVVKTYWAAVESLPDQDKARLVHWLTKDSRRNVVHAYQKQRPGSLKAELNYELKGRSGKWFLLEIGLLSGRPHQIRTQLKAIGCPIVGDLKYGSSRKTSNGSIMLHARRLELPHPVKGASVIVTADPQRAQPWIDFMNLAE